MHPEFAPVAFLAAFLLAIPLIGTWRSGNISILSTIAWLFVTDMIYAVDAIVWAGNVDIRAPVWCDISTKLIVGASFAVPASCLCLCAHLEKASSMRQVHSSASDKRRRQYFDAFVCFGLPTIYMVLHFIVQGHRFDIIENYGCRPTVYYSIPSLMMVSIPPIVVEIISLGYGAIVVRNFMRGRESFADILKASGLTPSRYLRLICMSIFQMLLMMTLTSIELGFNLMRYPLQRWTTYADVHHNFSFIGLYPFETGPLKECHITWWVYPACTFICVGFLSSGQDAVEEYKKCISWCRSHILRRHL
ncbi:hypothetical protein K443DRAFT_6515 [Laccaria amethystina LaAM-08-1]|uniref:Fungal pheromone STE3G-protein-coupled receptor n=1 Tax=Laccaria amethystina LaAM-08-1 TaxID=1095629 RepID=A0A0C9WSZ3_9AGAR|nr:hypothetical protein K443DRAFT_6515 [Laccaria amethystina LaAM-08-1]